MQKKKVQKIPVPLERLAACLIAARVQFSPNHSVSFSGDSYHQPFYTTSKANTFDTHISCEINTNPITYPIDVHWRWISIPVISHTPRGQDTPQVPCLVTHAYTPYTMETQQIKYKNILSVISVMEWSCFCHTCHHRTNPLYTHLHRPVICTWPYTLAITGTQNPCICTGRSVA